MASGLPLNRRDRKKLSFYGCPAPSMRQGERSFQLFNADVAQAGVLSVWQTLQALGI